MRKRFASSRAEKNQSGYALLLVLFLITLVLIATMSIGLRVLTEGRREKEKEMVWRGNQYVRGIKLYYAKFGRFPTSMDDLIKPSNGNIRFMRQAYKDPMNKDDGSWRLIYVGPAGQLIGSLKPQPSNIQMPGAGGQLGATGQPGASFGSSPGTSSGTSSFGFGSQPGAAGGTSNAGSIFGGAGGTSTAGSSFGASATGTDSSATGTDASGTGTDANGNGTDSQNVSMGDTPTIMGGSIIGVGSKVNERSVMVYEKAKNYRLFEFVWDPSKDLGIVSSPAPLPGTTPGTTGDNPFGSQPNGSQPNQANPQPNPGPPLANPNPQP